jgi:beta-glucanase (GH16 family)
MEPTARQRRRRHPWLVLAVVAGVALLVAAALLATRRTSLVNGTPSACGSESSPVLDGRPLACTFDDEFDGTTLDPTRWQALSTTRVGFHSGFECFVNDGQHVAVGGGRLQLTLSYSQPGNGCRSLGLAFESGMVLSRGRFAQAYGRFTIRAQLPATPGVQPALWLYPQQLTYGKWPRSGEIDIAEVFGSAAQTWPHLHYLGPTGELHPGKACSVSPNASGFHTYTVDWTPSAFAFRYDGVPCVTIDRWTPAAPLVAPEPFDQPFYVLLELATGIGTNSPGPGMPVPQTMQVDYVRVWGRSHGS